MSEGGVEGPYRLIEGNLDKPFGDALRRAVASGRTQYHYDAVAAGADHFEGPYSHRWTLGVGAGHNKIFADAGGRLWATFFRTPSFGYCADPARIADAAVPGVVRLKWTGPQDNRLYVQRHSRGLAISE